MNRWLSIIILFLFLVSCEEEVDPKEAVIQQEVSKRVETIRADLKTDQDRRYTLRVITLCLLAGGSLIALFRLGENGSWFPTRANLLDARRENPPPGRRIIEPSATDRRPLP